MKNKKVYGLVGVAALAAVGGTFAYYSAEQTFTNPFKTTYYSTQATEKFNPSGDNNKWKPGAEIDKDVYATNTGDGEVWVRIKFDEVWRRGDETLKGWNSADIGQFNPFSAAIAGASETELWQDKDMENAKEITVTDPETGEQKVVKIGQDDGLVVDDKGSVVLKTFEEGWEDSWYFNPEDGYFYYRTALVENESTTKLLDAVTLCGDADMGRFDDNAFVCALSKEPTTVPKYGDGNEWLPLPTDKTLQEFLVEKYGEETVKKMYVYTYKENKLDADKSGYANADYNLNITVEFVQADEDAEAALAMGWKWTPLSGIPVAPIEP